MHEQYFISWFKLVKHIFGQFALPFGHGKFST